jgi:hypothetical protein
MEQQVTAGSQGVTGAITARSRLCETRLALKDLPATILNQVNDKLINGQSSRTVSDWLSQRGHTFSFKAVNRYNQNVLKPAMRIGAQVQRMQAIDSGQPQTAIEHAEAVREVTKQVLAADPILACVDRLDSEVWSTYEDARAEGDLRARTQALSVARAAIETRGKAIQHPGFVTASPVTVDARQTVIVLPAPTAQPALSAPYIDAEVVELQGE